MTNEPTDLELALLEAVAEFEETNLVDEQIRAAHADEPPWWYMRAMMPWGSGEGEG